MLHIHYSNRTENLADRLAAELRRPHPGASVFEPELLVVNNHGMGRWLQLHVARRNGIAANLEIRFPAEWVWNMLERALPDVPEVNPFAPARIAWHLFALFDEIVDDPLMAPIARYLEKGKDARQWALAEQLARNFDQYVVYRPDWIGEWESGAGDDWQAALWRKLISRLGSRHWATLQREFVNAVDAGAADSGGLARRVSVFGIPALSPGYLHLLDAAGRLIDVHLYALNPCRQYWGDIVRRPDAETGTGYFERGNTLLANFGLQGRDALDIVQSFEAAEDEAYIEADTGTLLGAIQNDILDLRERGQDGPAPWPDADDDSIAIHACHSPMREIEVLHDQLLARFSRDPELSPADVLVVAPDIETYAPIIDAVFATAPEPLRIPFSLADRSARSSTPLFSAVLSLLDLDAERMTPEYVFSLLEHRAVAAKFDLEAAELDVIRDWVRATSVRWGFDEEHRRRLSLPGTAEHTWRAALDRMVLGYAMPVDAPFRDVLPLAGVEGANARAMGRFHSFMVRLDALSRRLAEPRAMERWLEVLEWVLESFFECDAADERALQRVRDIAEELREMTAESPGNRPVSSDLLKTCLQARIEAAEDRSGFLAGGVTFTSMVPLRSVPFKLVCAIGMCDGEFPRAARSHSLDRMSRRYRRGDRSRRDDDRFGFLEALLSARKGFYVSYVGRDIRDDTPIPPSVLVSDLIDYIGQGLPKGEDREANRHALHDRLVTVHPLQSFSPLYFRGDPRLPAYGAQLAGAADALGSPHRQERPFVDVALEAPDFDAARVDLEELVWFYSNPVRYLLRRNLDVWLTERDESFEDREPFSIDWDAGEVIRDVWMSQYAASGDIDGCEHALRLRSVLPHGAVGRVLLEREIIEFEKVRPRISEHLERPLLPPLTFDQIIGSTRLVGSLNQVREGGLFLYRLRQSQARDRLRLVLEHLCGCAAGLLGDTPSTLLTLSGALTLAPVEPNAARDLLVPWVETFIRGQSEAVHFFPRAAWAMFESMDGPDAVGAARREWAGSEFKNGESAHPDYQKVFGGSDPIDAAFESNVRALLVPLAGFMTVQ